jgi:hypothetical protein
MMWKIVALKRKTQIINSSRPPLTRSILCIPSLCPLITLHSLIITKVNRYKSAFIEGSQINPYAEEKKVIKSMAGSFVQSELQNDDEADKVFRRSAINSVPRPIPLITEQYSLKPDMIFGY